MNPATYIRERIRSCEPEMAYRPSNSEELAYWTVRVLAALTEAIGLKSPVIPLDPEFESPVALDGYTRTGVVFRSQPGLWVNGYLLVPDGSDAPRPGVLCLHGHGAGVDTIVGLARDDYQFDFAIQCVKQGYVTLAIEQFSFGKRSSYGNGEASCHPDSMAALALGETMVGWRVSDAMRAVDLMVSLPQIDPTRIATMGISGGGLTSLFTAALDQRVTAGVVSGYFNTFAGSIHSVFHCPDNYIPGVLQIIEMPELSALICPRWLFVESGREDDIFPIATFRQAVGVAQEVYQNLGVPDRFGYEEFEGGHHFHGVGAFDFLKRALA